MIKSRNFFVDIDHRLEAYVIETMYISMQMPRRLDLSRFALIHKAIGPILAIFQSTRWPLAVETGRLLQIISTPMTRSQRETAKLIEAFPV